MAEINSTTSVILPFRSMAFSDPDPDITDLPFVGDGEDGKRSFWTVPTTGNYGIDCAIGERFAADYLAYLLNQPTGLPNLYWVVEHMDFQDDSTKGVRVGFLVALLGFAKRVANRDARYLGGDS